MSRAIKAEFALPKHERLSGKAVFDYLFQHATSTRVGVLKCYYMFDAPAHLVRAQVSVGIAVPKKFHRRAHDRNRYKRLLREAYRLNKHILASALQPTERNIILLFVYNTKNPAEYQYITKLVVRLLNELRHVAETTTTPADTSH
jgi:ribonuclease P protein component